MSKEHRVSEMEVQARERLLGFSPAERERRRQECEEAAIAERHELGLSTWEAGEYLTDDARIMLEIQRSHRYGATVRTCPLTTATVGLEWSEVRRIAAERRVEAL